MKILSRMWMQQNLGSALTPLLKCITLTCWLQRRRNGMYDVQCINVLLQRNGALEDTLESILF